LKYQFPSGKDGRAIAGNEYEQVGRAAKPEVPDRDPVRDIIGDVVEEDEPVGEATKQIEPDIVPVRRENGFAVHRCNVWWNREAQPESKYTTGNHSAGGYDTPIDFA
jgi:hypothetical protein